MSTILGIHHRLKHHCPRKIPGRRFLRRSAVNLLIKEDEEQGLMVLMIQRAVHKKDPWSGHMAFPGGRMDKSDRNILAAAQRELEEEVGVDGGEHTEYMGRLSDLLTRAHLIRRPMIISPFVFSVDQLPPLNPNYEVADTIWIPLKFLADLRNRQTMRWRHITLPCYFYQQKRIWGLSLSMLDELIGIMDSSLNQPQYGALYRNKQS